ncbi:MAG: hypothetical protein WHX93_04915 [bacterium]
MEQQGALRQGDRVEIYRASGDQRWESYMARYIGMKGVVTDPDVVINDPDALVEVTLEGTGGTHRFPQDCLRRLGTGS